MAEQPGNRIPTYPKPAPHQGWSNPEEAVNPKNGETGDSGSLKATNGQGGAPDWVSRPNPENTFNIDAGERFKQQGNLPKRKSLNEGDGDIE